MILIPIEKMLKSRYDSKIPLRCDVCQCDFDRVQKLVKSALKLKSQTKHFCSKKCANLFQKKELVNLNCAYCKKNFTTSQGDFNKRSKDSKLSLFYCSKLCANKNNTYRSQEQKNKTSNTLKKRWEEKLKNAFKKKYGEELKNTDRVVFYKGRYRISHVKNTCVICSKEFFHCRKLQTCSGQCLSEASKRSGKKGGSTTASSPFQKRNRSSNEKMFFQKILAIYPDAISNKRIFDGYDADIIIPSKKIAIHWNGVWHYQSVVGEELLHRVQAKDKLRYEAVERHGFTNYVVQDLGAMNESKVEQEYLKFIEFMEKRTN